VAAKSRLVIGYARVSTDGQAQDGQSLDAQVAKIRAWGTLKDITVDDTIVDAGASAKNLDRPAVARLLALVDAGRVGVVIVSKLDRLTRSVRDLADLLERFDRRDVSLVSVDESLDTQSAAGRLVLNIMASVSQWEREAIGERTAAVLAHKRTRGERISGALPFGYALAADGVRLVPHPDEQRALVELRELRASGLTLRAVADTLNRRGHRLRSGRPWTVNRVFALAKEQRRAA
jgi:site-specific DNA recombinase